MNSEKIVEIKDLIFSYKDQTIYNSVNLDVFKNEFCCIVGANGSGKSTLLKLILGLIKPLSGSINILGGTPQNNSHHIGYMPQSINFDEQFPVSVLDVTLMGRINKSIFSRFEKKDYEFALNALEKVDLTKHKDKCFSKLSGGQRQRVLIARAIVSQPKLLIFDEPTASIDALVESKLFNIMSQLKNEMAIIMVSHDIRFVTDLVDKVICVDGHDLLVHQSEAIGHELIAELTQGHYKVVKHDHCEHGGSND